MMDFTEWQLWRDKMQVLIRSPRPQKRNMSKHLDKLYVLLVNSCHYSVSKNPYPNTRGDIDKFEAKNLHDPQHHIHPSAKHPPMNHQNTYKHNHMLSRVRRHDDSPVNALLTIFQEECNQARSRYLNIQALSVMDDSDEDVGGGGGKGLRGKNRQKPIKITSRRR